MSDLMMTRFATIPLPGRRLVPRDVGLVLHVGMRTYLTRRALPDLTARELADVGLDRDHALAEAARLPWDLHPGPRKGRQTGVLGRLQLWLERARTRRLLVRMQERELGELGLSRSNASTEASKPFWRG